jgi:hypothetical protein
VSSSIYLHEFNKDVPIGEAWVESGHYQKHIEVVGGSGQGKTTLAEWLMLGILERNEAGLLLIDPTGDSYKRYLGWLASGRVQKDAWLVDPGDKILHYNPLAIDKDPLKLASHVSGLYEALHLIQSDSSPGQHRQVARFVTSTLRALIEANLTLADAFNWLTDDVFRAKHLRAITHEETLKEWARGPSANDLKSTMNFFAAFWEHDGLKQMFSADGFVWERAYSNQPVVLVNLASMAGSLRFSKAVAAMFLTGLLEHARVAPVKKRWYAVIDDATDYTPAHVSQLLTLGRHFDLFLILIHHQGFDGRLQGAVDIGCRTKFFFGDIPSEYRWTVQEYYSVGTRYPQERVRQVSGPSASKSFTCLEVFDRKAIQSISLEPTPESYEDVDPYKARIYTRPEYQKRKTSLPSQLMSSSAKRAASPKPSQPPLNRDRRGK